MIFAYVSLFVAGTLAAHMLARRASRLAPARARR
ncbi:hypothetical protein AWB76_02060 [Caballeronia temeraria]|uniref:Uncharacterized protein n=1 Tax=Caballeronia temeraria TaxID=1777137 RepID=A0A158AAP7_9BURK|nr:hypothetical protein AWB76_02060 [Caballeronia temeraria]